MAFLVSLILIGLFYGLVIYQPNASATGDDSPAECMVSDAYKTDIADEPTFATWTSSSSETVTGVCIKTGQGAFNGLKHTGVITQNGAYDSCFSVTGIGTNSVTVTESGLSGCKDISHIDVIVGTQTTPTPTQMPPTPTPTEVPPTPTPTQVPPTPTPTEVPPTPTPTDRPSCDGECVIIIGTPTPTPTTEANPTPTPTTAPTATPTQGTNQPTATPTPGSNIGGGDVLGTTTTEQPKRGTILGVTTYADTGTGAGYTFLGLTGLVLTMTGIYGYRRAKTQKNR